VLGLESAWSVFRRYKAIRREERQYFGDPAPGPAPRRRLAA
jgi:hypothetical protein